VPLYDFKCRECGHEFEELSKVEDKDSVPCKECSGKCDTLITTRGKDWFKEGWWDDFDVKPIYVSSKSQLRELCKKYEVYARCLD